MYLSTSYNHVDLCMNRTKFKCFFSPCSFLGSPGTPLDDPKASAILDEKNDTFPHYFPPSRKPNFCTLDVH